MLDTVKPTATAAWIVPGPFRCTGTSVDPEESSQVRTWYVPTYSCSQFQIVSEGSTVGKRDPKFLRTGFCSMYNYNVLERSSEYTVGVRQSSNKEGELYVYIFFPILQMCVS